MTNRINRDDRADQIRRAREAERQREIERAREAAKKAAAEAAQKAAAEAALKAQQKAAADVGENSGARERFAAQGACVDDPRRLSTTSANPADGPRRGIGDRQAADAAAVDKATKKIEAAAAKVESASSDDDKRQAALEATKAVKEAVLSVKDPAQRKLILEQSGASLEKIGKGLDKLSGDDTKKAVADLADAAEAAGPAGADAIAAPLAQAAPALFAGHGDNQGELMDGVQSAVEGGHGALLGAALAQNLGNVDKGLATEVADATAEGLDKLKSEFSEASEKAGRKDAELGAISAQWQGTLSPEQMKAGVDKFKSSHGEYAERDAKAAALTKALAGAGYAQQHGASGDLASTSRAALEQVPALAQTDGGARAIGDALVREGKGEATFMKSAGEIANRDEKSRDAFVDAAQRSVLVTQSEALARGDTRGLVQALRGAGQVLPDADSKRDFNAFADDIEKVKPGTPPDQLAVAIASSARSIAGGVSDQKTARLDDVESITTKTSFKVFGASLGAVSLGQSALALRDGVTAREAVNTVVGAAGLGGSVAGIALAEGAPKLLSKGLPVVGYALSTFDTVNALKKGDELGAVAAAAPLAGAVAGAAIGAASGSIAPGVGTAIGGAVGALVGLGIGVGRKIFEDSPAESLEKSTQSFLQGALEGGGLSSSQAEKASHRLRDVNDDFFGAGHSIKAIAARTGESPQDVLTKVANLDDDRLHDFVKQSLEIKDNGQTIRDLEVKVADGKAKASSIPAFALDSGGLDALIARYRSL